MEYFGWLLGGVTCDASAVPHRKCWLRPVMANGRGFASAGS